MSIDTGPTTSTNGVPYQPLTGPEMNDYLKAKALGFVPNGSTQKADVIAFLTGLGVVG